MAVISVDFDHVLKRSDNTPCPNAKEGINALREAGHKVLIFSCNSPDFIKKWLNDNDIRYDWVYDPDDDWSHGKPVCDLYLDDRGYAFPYDGDWLLEVEKIFTRLAERQQPKSGGF